MSPASLWQLKKWKVFQVLHSTTPLSDVLWDEVETAMIPSYVWLSTINTVGYATAEDLRKKIKCPSRTSRPRTS